MEQLVTDLSHITLNQTYETSFDEIIRFAEEVRRNAIPADERNVTKNLAMPFTTRGLLVLLTEPRQYHPWHEGIDGVIAECNTLASLNEGIEIGSNEDLSLTNGVSVLDVRPFLPKEQYPNLDAGDWEKLYKLVFLAIDAKRPQVLLCMGSEAKTQLMIRIQRDPGRYRDTQIVYSMHPSRAVNYNNDDLTMRDNLFRSICEACGRLNNEWDDNTPMEKSAAHTRRSTEFISAEKTDCLEAFLDVLLRSCFLPDFRLPSHNIRMGQSGLYKLENWHELWLKHMEKIKDSTTCHKLQALAYLIPVFKALNILFRRNSRFLHVYEIVDWQRVDQVLVGRFSEIESRCYLLAGGAETNSGSATRNDRARRNDRGIDLWHELNRITAHSTRLWEAKRPHPVRNCEYVGFSE